MFYAIQNMLRRGKRRRFGVVWLAALMVLLIWAAVAAHLFPPRKVFQRYVISLADSVHVKAVDANDYFFINPEPVVRIHFSASAGTLHKIMISREAIPYDDFAVGSAAGPPWFRPANQLQGLQQFRLRNKIRGASEFLWIDESGTNAFYLLFGV